jgi:hypothetical protein
VSVRSARPDADRVFLEGHTWVVLSRARTMSKPRGVLSAYQTFKKDAKGWGVPPFQEFRSKLWPLRTKYSMGQWGEKDIMYVLKLEEAGSGYALQRLFGKNPAAKKILGENPKQQEPLPKSVLDQFLRSLIRDCRRNNWGPGEYLGYIEFLDSGRTISDPGKSSESSESDVDEFTTMYKSGGENFRRFIREALARAADATKSRTRG